MPWRVVKILPAGFQAKIGDEWISINDSRWQVCGRWSESVIFWVLLAAVTSFVFATVLTRRFCDAGSRLHLLDHPNERSLHSRPTPRTGGVAILSSFGLSSPIWIFSIGTAYPVGWLVTGAGIIAVLSFLDDWRGLSVGGRFLGHLFGSGLVVMGADLALPLMPLDMSMFPMWLIFGLSMIFLVWMINLYNFMDGMDGFAGGMTIIGFGTFAIFGWLAGNLPFAVLSLSLASAAGGFMVFNFPPARIFMGDAGSASLGLLAGGFILWGARDNVFPFWTGVLVFSPFIVDASVTLLRRMLRGERFWQAHKTHYYQRLVLLGWGHRKTVLAEYVLMFACAVSALWMVSTSLSTQLAVLIFWSFVYTVLAAWVRRLERGNVAKRPE